MDYSLTFSCWLLVEIIGLNYKITAEIHFIKYAVFQFSLYLQEKDINLSGEHVREGLTCVISVKVANPEFEGQTKVLLLDFVFFLFFLIYGHI